MKNVRKLKTQDDFKAILPVLNGYKTWLTKIDESKKAYWKHTAKVKPPSNKDEEEEVEDVFVESDMPQVNDNELMDDIRRFVNFYEEQEDGTYQLVSSQSFPYGDETWKDNVILP